jgi:uncharacterized membrane protein YgcG
MKMLLRLAALGVAVTGAGAVAIPAASALPTTVMAFVPANVPQGAQVMNVLAGDEIDITAIGTGYYGYEGAPGCVGYPNTYPDGTRYDSGTLCSPKDDPNAELSGAPIGLLIARIGNGPWFNVGGPNYQEFFANASGVLTLAYNDSYYPDNENGYSATVTDWGGGSGSSGGGGGTVGGGGGGGCVNACRL